MNAPQSAQIIGMALASKFSLKELDNMQLALADTLAAGASNQSEVDATIHSLETVAVARELVKAEDERLRASVTILREVG